MKIGETFKLIDLDAAAVFGSPAGLKYSTGYAPPEMVVIKEAVLSEGDVVDVRHGGGKKYFPGKIGKANADGSYAVVYNDGDKEAKVARELIEGGYGGEGHSA
jgi:hypothetical protein